MRESKPNGPLGEPSQARRTDGACEIIPTLHPATWGLAWVCLPLVRLQLMGSFLNWISVAPQHMDQPLTPRLSPIHQSTNPGLILHGFPLFLLRVFRKFASLSFLHLTHACSGLCITRPHTGTKRITQQPTKRRYVWQRQRQVGRLVPLA